MQVIIPINKKLIENKLNKNIIKKNENFFLFSDKLRKFGFNLAKFSGLSVGLSDFHEIFKKHVYLKNKEKNLENLKINWNIGIFSANEYYSSSLRLWNFTFDFLKDINFSIYEKHSFFNALNLMIISGARGDWNQFLQMSEFRGLLLNQEGKLLDIPVKNNFKSGLNLAEFSISAYSARKGIIDTAQKTATAGFLTRRLIFLNQNSIIKINNCFTTKIMLSDFILSKNIQNFSLKNNNLLKSIFLCEVNFNSCQLCYGFASQTKRLIAIGSPIGIVSAHSISEPTTQMTLKTFHSGGATSENEILDYQLKNKSGKIIFSNLICGFINLDVFGHFQLYFYKKQKINKTNWNGNKNHFNILKNYSISLKKFFIENNFLINSKQTIGLPFLKIFKKNFSKYEGEIFFKSIILKKEIITNYNLEVTNNYIFENGFIEIRKSSLISFYIDSSNSFFKNFFLNTFFNINKILFTKYIDKLKFDYIYQLTKKKFNFNINLNNLLLKFNDNFTLIKNFIYNLNLLKYNKSVKKKIFNFNILLKLKNSKYKTKNYIKLDEHTILKKNIGDFILVNDLLGYKITTNNRDNDIVNAVDQIESILINYELINYNSLFTPFFNVSQKNKIINIINSNLVKTSLDLNNLIKYIFSYQEHKNGNIKGINIATCKFQIILSNTLAAIYSSYDTSVFANHFDLVLKKLTSFFVFKNDLEKSNYFDNNDKKLKFNLQEPYKLNFNQMFKKNIFNMYFIFDNLEKNILTNYQNKSWLIKKIKKNFKINFKFLKETYLTYDKIKLIKKNFNIPFKFLMLNEIDFVKLSSQFFEKELKYSDQNEISAAALYGHINWFSSLRENILTGDTGLIGTVISKFKDSLNSNFFFKN